MYCLSQFCCFCFCNEANMKLLHKITSSDVTFLDMVKVVFPDMQFFGIGRVLSICDGCVERVREMYAFHQASVRHNLLLMEYVKELRLFGNEIGDIRIHMIDIDNSVEVEYVNYEDLLSENEIKIELEDLCEGGSTSDGFGYVATTCESTRVYCNDTATCGTKDTLNENLIDKDVEIKTEKGCNVENVLQNSGKLEDLMEQGHENDATPVDPLQDISTTPPDKNTKFFKCETCGKYLSRLDALKNHNMIHTGEKPFICHVCGKSYPISDTLKTHLMIHTGIKPYKCETCGKAFVHPTNLRRHTLTHAVEKPYECNICGKCFPIKKNLERHVVIHSENGNKCEVCGRSFSFLGNLRRHSMIHTGDKPYECDVCGKCFSCPSNLKKHRLIHTGEKPYICDMCGKGFVQSNTLKDHLLTHSGEKPFRCEKCGKAFPRSSNLKRHVLTHGHDISQV